MNQKKEAPYIPALNQNWLTPLYDPVLMWGMREETFKRYLVSTLDLRPGSTVLDLGCGTGTLTVMVKRSQPLARVIGLDGDPRVLAIAKSKAALAGTEIQWEKGLAFQIPYPSGTFDRVVSSLMTHHLTKENKVRAFQEINRVLKPGGEVHILDFGPPHGWMMAVISNFMARLEEARDNFQGQIPVMLQQAGFAEVTIPRRFSTIFGELSHYKTTKPV